MGSRGPVPKRSSQRRRENKTEIPIETALSDGAVRGPELGVEGVHPLAAEWYESLRVSGQAVFFEPSDWQTARVWADLLSRQLSSGRPSAQMVAAWSAAASELLTTEGSRRRLRIELAKSDQSDVDEDAAILQMNDYLTRLAD